MTPQKVFVENFHFWIWPVLLVIVKVIFDILPRVVFIALMAAAVGAFFLFNKAQEKKIEKAAEEVSSSVDEFLNELDKEAEEKRKQEQRLKEKQEKQKQAREKASAKQHTKSSKAAVEDDADDEDEDDMLIRMAQNRAAPRK